MKIEYKKDWLIEASPHPLVGGKWSTRIIIWEKKEGTFYPTPSSPFTGVDKWDSESEAITHSINYGKMIIDGKTDVSIDDL